ncbi:hypothetical protein DRH14_03800 [Candidatus Shapirobacteria bacterium]|nr:MAG: hypothetical protein DRH14_03800 [Candidatus Shapirobacteria bacterium]
MLDKVIEKHIDKQGEIEESLKKEIDRIIGSIDIDAIVENAQAELDAMVKEIEDLIASKYAPHAIENGLELAKIVKDMIKKDKEIKIQKTKNPKLNEDG